MTAFLSRPAMFLALAGIALLWAAMLPGSAAAQNLCHGRRHCHQAAPVSAGRDAQGQALRLIVVSAPAPHHADTDPASNGDCTQDISEYWLVRGSERTRHIGGVCPNGRISEGIQMTVGNNRLTTAFFDGSGCCYANYRVAWSLFPLRLVSLLACYSDVSDGDERWTQTTLDPRSLRGETVADIHPVGGPVNDSAGGCEPQHPLQRWLPVVRLPMDGQALRTAGAALGDCATVMGPQGGGYVLAGRRTATEIRLFAAGPRSLLIQVADPDEPSAPAGTPLARRSHIEVWSSDAGLTVREAGDEERVSQTLIDPDDGAVARGSASGGVTPQVAHWRVRLAGGRTARVFLLTYPPGAFEGQDVHFAVIYRQFRAGQAVLALASSQFSVPQLSGLGESFDVSPFTRCAVRGGALSLTATGLVQAPFQVNEAGGLRILN